MIAKDKKQEIIEEYGRTPERHRFTRGTGRYLNSSVSRS